MVALVQSGSAARRARRAAVWWALLPSALLTTAASRAGEPPAAAHPGPPVYIEAKIEAAEVILEVTGEQVSILTCLERPDELQALQAPVFRFDNGNSSAN